MIIRDMMIARQAIENELKTVGDDHGLAIQLMAVSNHFTKKINSSLWAYEEAMRPPESDYHEATLHG